VRVAVEDESHGCPVCGGVKQVEGRNFREIFGRDVSRLLWGVQGRRGMAMVSCHLDPNAAHEDKTQLQASDKFVTINGPLPGRLDRLGLEVRGCLLSKRLVG
jgi:hypothetical protein